MVKRGGADARGGAGGGGTGGRRGGAGDGGAAAAEDANGLRVARQVLGRGGRGGASPGLVAGGEERAPRADHGGAVADGGQSGGSTRTVERRARLRYAIMMCVYRDETSRCRDNLIWGSAREERRPTDRPGKQEETEEAGEVQEVRRVVRRDLRCAQEVYRSAVRRRAAEYRGSGQRGDDR